MPLEDFASTPIQKIAKGDVITVKQSTSIKDALNIMKGKDIHTLGVTDVSDDCILGLVSVLDIMTYISFAGYRVDDNPDNIIAAKSLDTQIGDITGVFHTETNRIWSYEETTPLSTVLRAFGLGVHRAVSITTKGEFKFISQTDIVKFLLTQMPEIFSKTLEENNMGDPEKSQPFSIMSNQTTLSAFRRMEMENLQALPVLDFKNGCVVATISSSDVRNISQDQMNDVLRPVLEFLKLKKGTVEQPQICERSETLGNVAKRLIESHHHHMWVVDEHKRHIATVSLSDIILQFEECCQ